MADILTYNPADPEAPEFSAEDQENIAVGEALQQEQNQLLAGKYENAEALEKAYIELQKKLGEDGQEQPTDEQVTEEKPPEVEPEEAEESTSVSLINSASAEFAESGELTAETMEQFNQMSSKDLVEAYMQMSRDQPQQATQVNDLTDGEVNAIKNVAGGEDAYSALTQWAGENLPANIVQGFDNLVNSGDSAVIQLAVAGLKAQYENVNGYEGRMLTGKAPTANADVYKSQAQVVEAMSDPRYDNDPAYRQGVYEKLERSNNLQF